VDECKPLVAGTVQPGRGAGAYTRPLPGSPSAGFNTAITQWIPQSMLMLSRKMDECKPMYPSKSAYVVLKYGQCKPLARGGTGGTPRSGSSSSPNPTPARCRPPRMSPTPGTATTSALRFRQGLGRQFPCHLNCQPFCPSTLKIVKCVCNFEVSATPKATRTSLVSNLTGLFPLSY
jgi:hypothetical protein